MPEGCLPAEKMGTRKSETADRDWRGFNFQRLRFLRHGLSERFLPRSGEERRAGGCARVRGPTGGGWGHECYGAATSTDTAEGRSRTPEMLCAECPGERGPQR